MNIKLTRKEKALLRQLAEEAWEAQLNREFETLFEAFCRWADNGLSAFDLSEQIHEFHQGVSRDLYNQYTAIDPVIAVSRAIASGILGEESLDPSFLEKLEPVISAFRDNEGD